MEEINTKREVQVHIIPTLSETNGQQKATKEETNQILRTIALGTNFRTALEGIVNAKKGALVVVELDGINTILDGGFKINSKFTPQKMVELSKMDGAIVLSKDMKKLLMVIQES